MTRTTHAGSLTARVTGHHQKHRLAHALTLAFASCVVWSVPASAQQASAAAPAGAASAPEADDGSVLGEVVVTAQKRSEKIQDIPAPITAISGSAINDSNIRLSTDVERLAPSLSGQGGGRTGKPRWFLRGIGTNDPNQTIEAPIAIYVDEVVVGLTRLQSFPLFDLDRVEVLVGPQGTLWGKNNTGGALHFVSKRPTFTKDGFARVTVGDYNTRVFEGGFSDAIIEDVLAARLSVYNESYDGWAKNILTQQNGPQLGDFNARFQLLAYPTPDLEAHLIVGLRNVKTRNTPAYPVGGFNAPGSAVTQNTPGGIIYQGQTAAQIAAGGGYRPPYGDDPNVYSDFWGGKDSADQERRSGTLKLNYNLGGLTFSSVSGWTSGKGDAYSSVGVPLNTTLARSSTEGSDAFRQFTQELRVASPSNQTVSWLVGAYYYKLTAQADSRTARFANGGSNTISTNRDNYNDAFWDQTSTSKAVFGNVKWKFDEQAAISAGLRVTKEHKRIEESSLNIGDTAGNAGIVNFVSENGWFLPGGITGSGSRVPLTLRAKDSWTNTTFDVTPEYRFAPNVLGYLRVATGFRSGGFNQTITQPTGGTPYINKLKPETLRNIELGAKSTLLGGRVTLNASVFHYELKNIQLNIQQSVVNAAGVVVTSASGQSDGVIKGAEIETEALLTSNWRAGAQLGLLRTEYKKFNYDVGGVQLNASGNKFYRAPRTQFRVNTDYTIFLGDAIGKVVLGTDWSYRSHIFHNATVQNDPLQETPGYWIGNLRATFRGAKDKWELTVFANNVTDENKPFLRQIVNNTNRSYPVSVGSPRFVGVQLTYKL